jgi:hypothetical protein
VEQLALEYQGIVGGRVLNIDSIPTIDEYSLVEPTD